MTISVKHVHVNTCVAAMGITKYSLLVLVILFSFSASKWNKVCFFIVGALHPSQQLFIHVGTFC